MKLPYDLQQLYIKMLSNSFTNREVTQRPHNNIIEVVYSAPDGKYEADFAVTTNGMILCINTYLGDAWNYLTHYKDYTRCSYPIITEIRG